MPSPSLPRTPLPVPRDDRDPAPSAPDDTAHAPPVPASAGGPVQSVERALRILSAFGTPGRELTVGELARLLDVHKSTASRLVATLLGAGYLTASGGEGLRLGPELVRLGRVADGGRTLEALARPAMDALGRRTAETVTLSVAESTDAVTVAQVDTTYVIGTRSWVGAHTPLHASSDGKVLLAFGAAPVPGGDLGATTRATTTDRVALEADLAQVRRRGWAIALGDLEDGLHGVAAPVLDRSGRCRAALSVSGPAYRLPADGLPDLAVRCRDAATHIGALLADHDLPDPQDPR